MAFSSSIQTNVCKMEQPLLSRTLNDSDYEEMPLWHSNITTEAHPPIYEKETLKILFRWIYFGLLGLLSQGILISITVALSRKCFELGLEKTAKHAFYCTLGFVLFIGQAILVRNPYDIIGLIVDPYRDLAHIILGMAALVCGIYGVAIKYFQKEQRKHDENEKREIKHFRSQHGFYGIIGPLLFVLCIVLGFCVFFTYNRKIILPLHRLLGLISFIVLTIAQFLGFNTGFARRNLSVQSIKLYKFFTVMVLFTTLNFSFRRSLVDLYNIVPVEVFDFLGLQH